MSHFLFAFPSFCMFKADFSMRFSSLCSGESVGKTNVSTSLLMVNHKKQKHNNILRYDNSPRNRHWTGKYKSWKRTPKSCIPDIHTDIKNKSYLFSLVEPYSKFNEKMKTKLFYLNLCVCICLYTHTWHSGYRCWLAPVTGSKACEFNTWLWGISRK